MIQRMVTAPQFCLNRINLCLKSVFQTGEDCTSFQTDKYPTQHHDVHYAMKATNLNVVYWMNVLHCVFYNFPDLNKTDNKASLHMNKWHNWQMQINLFCKHCYFKGCWIENISVGLLWGTEATVLSHYDRTLLLLLLLLLLLYIIYKVPLHRRSKVLYIIRKTN